MAILELLILRMTKQTMWNLLDISENGSKSRVKPGESDDVRRLTGDQNELHEGNLGEVDARATLPTVVDTPTDVSNKITSFTPPPVISLTGMTFRNFVDCCNGLQFFKTLFLFQSIACHVCPHKVIQSLLQKVYFERFLFPIRWLDYVF